MSKNLSKEARRGQLLNAAVKAFGEKGYHQTQVADIIAAAGVARGTFYLHFKSKREIFDCIMDDLFAQVRDEVRSLPREAVNEIPSQLMGNIQRVINLFLDRPVLAKLLFSASVGLDDEQDERLRHFYQQLLELIRRGLKQGQEMGFVRNGDYNILAISLLGSLKEVLYQSILGTEPLNRSAIFQEIYRLVLHGVANPEIVPQLEVVLPS